MSRIEKNAPLEKQLEEVKEDVLKEVRQHKRQNRPWLTCSFLVLFLFVCFFAWIFWVVAATGLIHVPVLSAFAYEQPSATREVAAGVPVSVSVQEQFARALTNRLQIGNGILTDRSVQIVLSEESLTATLRSILEESGFSMIDSSLSQVAVDSGKVELFLPVKKNARATAVLAGFMVEAKDGKIVITPTEFQIGALHFPDFLVTGILGALVQTQMQHINEQLAGFLLVKSVNLTHGSVKIEGNLSVEIQ